jgi:hypothetical protein
MAQEVIKHNIKNPFQIKTQKILLKTLSKGGAWRRVPLASSFRSPFSPFLFFVSQGLFVSRFVLLSSSFVMRLSKLDDWRQSWSSDLSWKRRIFFFSAKSSSSVLRLEEKRKTFSGVVVLGSLCSPWLVSTVKEALKSPGVEDFVKSFRKDSKVLIVRRGGNQAGRFMEVASFAIGGWKWFIWLPEDRDGRGWRQVAGELSKMVAFLESAFGSMVDAVGSSDGKKLQTSSGGHSFGVSPEKGGLGSSYAKVVRGAVTSSGKISASPRSMAEVRKLDLMPMSLFRDEENLREAVQLLWFGGKATGFNGEEIEEPVSWRRRQG